MPLALHVSQCPPCARAAAPRAPLAVDKHTAAKKPAAEDEAEPPGLLVDAPRLPPSAPRWRRRLFFALHSPAHHAALLACIALAICLALAALMVNLLYCRQLHDRSAPAVERALRGLRWASVALLFLMLAETALRCAVVGARAFFRQPIHVLDVGVLIAVVTVELAVSEQAAREAAGLLILVRLLRLARLLFSINNLAAERHAVVAERAARLEAALCAAEQGREVPHDAPRLRHCPREQDGAVRT